MSNFLHQQQKNWSLLVLFLGLIITNYAQQQLKFIPTFNGSRYALTNKVAINKDTLTIDLLKFYISDIKLLEDSIEVYSPKEKHYLFNLENPSAMSISLNVDSNINFNKIKFCIGIDSITNVAGAIGGTLDPINGMYWAWNSGYVNFKIEGTSTLSNARKNAFKFHLGGYQHPYNSYRAVLIKIDDLSKTAISINLEQFLTKIEFSQINSVMSPNTKSIELTNLLPPIFSTLKLD